jgi:predicted ATP-grasp superfamily ATP-dependent carboligase
VGCYAQERIDGVPASIVFAAAGRRAVPLGVSHQLVGEAAFGASGYRYCGNLLASASDPILTDDVVRAASEMAQHVAAAFDLVGLNGIDFIVRDGVPFPIEVNPRWSSSMELVERRYGVSMFGVHAAACADGVMPAFDLSRARRDHPTLGKAIVFAREDVVAGDTGRWLEDETVRDVPRHGARIAASEPVCTVFAEHAQAAGCRAVLVRRADAVYANLPLGT